MRNLLKATLSTIAVSAFLASCGDKSVEPLPGGSGGGTTINVTPQHHSVNINKCKVYIKYNAVNKPQKYDDSLVCEIVNGRPVASFSGLRKGNYYFYGVGYDPGIAQTVTGGLPFNISSNNSSVIDIMLPVTEAHTN
jgi:hypothetical protein